MKIRSPIFYMVSFTLIFGSFTLEDSARSTSSTSSTAAAGCPKRFSEPVPKGNPGSWVTTDDYPTGALRAEISGRVKFRINVSSLGRAENVEILEAASPDLGEATARLVMRRARFAPALRNCEPVPGEYEGSVVWSLP